MSSVYKYIKKILPVITLLLISGICRSQDSGDSYLEYLDSDTLLLNEVPLDTVRFYLSEDLSKAENTIRDTIFIPIDGKIYKLPYRITSTTNVVFRGKGQYFRLTGLPLSQEVELQNYITDLFKNPREKLKDVIPASQWKNSSIYLRYFEPFDKNSSNRPAITDEGDEGDEGEVNELDEFMADQGDEYVVQNYENFPLPETIDIEVDLRKTPGVVSILGLEFNYDKLNKRFQRLLLNYEKSGGNINRKSNAEKK